VTEHIIQGGSLHWYNMRPVVALHINQCWGVTLDG
jgi:hypothetical protein